MFLPNNEYAGAFPFRILGSSVLYLPGPGVLAKSSEKHPVCERLVIEYAAEAFLFAILAPRRVGSEYEFGDGTASPENLRFQDSTFDINFICFKAVCALKIFGQVPDRYHNLNSKEYIDNIVNCMQGMNQLGL